MDQVKVYLQVLKKHHFWVLCGMVSLFAFICWWMGANALAKETATNKQKVDSSFKNLTQVSSSGSVVNEKHKSGVEGEHKKLKERVLKEWREHYAQQLEDWKWPESVADIAKHEPGKDIPSQLRSMYKTTVFPEALMAIYQMAEFRHQIEVPLPEDPGAAGGTGAAPGQPLTELKWQGLVVWDEAHRKALEERYDFVRRGTIPTTTEVRVAQEDLWVLDNLARIIRKTNEPAGGDIGRLAVKKINSLEIGQYAIHDALMNEPKIAMPTTAPGGAGALEQPMGTPMETPADPNAGMTQEGREKQRDTALLDGRYLNALGEPLGAADVQPFAEFKQLFVRMDLVIDQRKLPELLVNCANAPMAVEVRRVTMSEPMLSRFHRDGAAPTGSVSRPTGGVGGFAKGGGRFEDDERGGGRFGRPMPAPSYAGGGGSQQSGIGPDGAVPPGQYDCQVEICGVVLIYNPPDDTKLASGTAEDATKHMVNVPKTPVRVPGKEGEPGRGGGGGGRGGVGRGRFDE